MGALCLSPLDIERTIVNQGRYFILPIMEQMSLKIVRSKTTTLNEKIKENRLLACGIFFKMNTNLYEFIENCLRYQ